MFNMIAKQRLRHSYAAKALAVLTLSVLAAAPLHAEPVADQLLAGVSVFEKNTCAVVRISFNSKIQYLSHFPRTATDELRIQINPIERASGDRKPKGAREGLRAPASERAGIHAIDLETNGATAALSVYFKRNTSVKVAQGVDFKSIIIAVAGPSPNESCQPVLDSGASEPPAQSADALRGTNKTAGKVSASVPASTLSNEQLAQLLVEARAELDKKNADRAVQLATRLIDSGNPKFRQDAQELLGNARESRGQTAHARAEYQDYLRDYPTGPGAQRVRERLAALESQATPAAGGAAGGTAEVGGNSKVALGDKNKGPGIPAATGQNGTYLPDAAKAPAEWTFSQYGSLSAFYNLNQGGRGFIETPRTNIGWDKENPYKTYQNSVLGNLDYDARFEHAAYAGRMRLSASNQHDFIYGTTEETRISALYFDGKIKDSGASARIGRQTSTSGGVLGRFDGAVGGYKFGNGIAVNGVAGSPVERSSDAPFAANDYFYGVSTDLTWASKSFETSGYIIEQRKDGRVDRQSVGLEGRYVKDGGAIYSTAEYDIHFNELNSAVFSASQYFADQSTASVNLDYRRAPILLVSNALQGQGVFKLSDLLQRYSSAEIDRIALDRTAESVTGTVALSRPLNSWLQWNGDVTVNRVGGMPASGGLDTVASMGTDYFISSQLIASSLWREGDMVSGGLRFADSYNTDRYLIELGFSYPINQDWRVNPMLRLGYMQYKTDTREEYQFLPSVRTSYAIFRDTTLELELGGKFIQTNSDMAKEYQTELLLLAGIRHDFSTHK
jgi:hypothetical protein